MTPVEEDTTASGRVREKLRAQILRGELPPGTRLMDRALAPQHGVSRNSVREALRLLVSDGLVTTTINTGASVRVLKPSDVLDIYAARRILEVGAVRASSHASDRTLTALDAAADTGTRERQLEHWREAGTASLAFHAALVALAGSARLDGFFAGLAAQLRLAFAVMPDEGAFQAQWVDRDRSIADLLLAGRRDAAEMELLAYLADSEAAVVDALRADHRGRTSSKH
jgi:DNA-binding GntR family transcriptional regulator